MGSKMSTLDDIGTYLLMALLCFTVGFFLAWGIVEAWVIFFEYGLEYNAVTLPAQLVWIILGDNIIAVLVLSGIFAVIGFILLAISVA